MSVEPVGPPAWVWRAFVGLAALAVVAVIVFGWVGLSRISQGRANSDRNDCRAEIAAERRDVLDQLSLRLDVDRTTHDLILGDVLLDRTGARPLEPGRDPVTEYETNHDEIDDDVILAETLPAKLPDVDTIVEHGGRMPVLHADGTIGSVRFAPCPTVD